MARQSRRAFLAGSALAALAGTIPLPRVFAASTAKHPVPFTLGVTTYTFRAFSLAQAIAMTRRLGLPSLTLKDMHLPLTSSDEDIAAARGAIRAAGLECSSCGVVYMKTADEVQRAFEYAAKLGAKLLVGAPDASLLKATERAVQSTGIALAIHNHGPNDARFPSPESAYSLVAGMDPRMGLCVDIGHTRRLGLDPAAEIERFKDRVFNVHFKDVSAADATGDTIEVGRGVIDIPGFLAAMIRLEYRGALTFEFEKDEKDPLPGMAESVGYTRGVLAAL